MLPWFQVANGILDGDQSGLELTAEDCYELGRAAIFSEYYYLAIEWFQESQNRLGKTQDGVYTQHFLQDLLENNADLAAAAVCQGSSVHS